MWQGIIPAVTTKFTEDGDLDHAEMERCFAYQMESGCHGLVACGTLGEGNMLTHEERLSVLRLCKQATGNRPALLTISEAGTREACELAGQAASAGADGVMIVPSPIYHTNRQETIANLRAIAQAADLPVMIYSNRVGYRVDVTPDMMEELADDQRFVAIKESSDDIRRATEIFNRLGDRYAVFTGVDNLAFEALTAGAVGWIAGLVVAFPKETVAIYELIRQQRYKEALDIYRWFRPLLDLDVSTFLVQQIKLAEVIEIGSNDRVRLPRMPLTGEHRKKVEEIVEAAIASRPPLPHF
ncbi:dihydrodipicolinate synthase family protein [Hoeflea prorocentri]|uniref:Dihydrodipicolinate synthase family protein n=1 Tax=Hoeflea prorocentri TaxID=1922333 RepID=A0A9X3UIJ9_9HYPH|nr:dihydrodipicolinate synthase family protein [Hoeflea prorocentri]MCY6381080.1 dihydrodipicolinate synthase family protein [Hoeflea prorocentri]MDA5398880.1 dihydrodipicolinate synthase family protein [Hoeflea prorocentri]